MEAKEFENVNKVFNYEKFRLSFISYDRVGLEEGGKRQIGRQFLNGRRVHILLWARMES